MVRFRNEELQKKLLKQGLRLECCVEVIHGGTPTVHQKKGDFIIVRQAGNDLPTLYSRINKEKNFSDMFDVTMAEGVERKILLVSKFHIIRMKKGRNHIKEMIIQKHPLFLQEDERVLAGINTLDNHEHLWDEVRTLSSSKEYQKAGALLMEYTEKMTGDIQHLSDILCDSKDDNWNYLAKYVNWLMLLT